MALSACVSISGTSETDLKKFLLESNTGQSVNWFYPQGVPQDVTTYIAPTPQAQFAVRLKMQQMATALAKLHEKRRAVIEKILGQSISADAPGRIQIFDKPRPIAMIGPNSEIELSYLMLQSVFRGALLEDVVEKSSTSKFESFGEDGNKYLFNAGFQPQNATSEQQRGLATVVNLIAQARDTEARGIVGTTWSIIHDDSLDGPWFKFAQLRDDLMDVESSYTGALLFLLAHEQGHITLGHYNKINAQQDNASYCRMQIALELQADEYALVLLSLTAANSPIPDMFYGGRSGASTGYRSFLQYSYPLAHFKEGTGCAYPTNKSRFERLAGKHKAQQDEAKALLNKTIEDEMSKAIRDIKKKIGNKSE